MSKQCGDCKYWRAGECFRYPPQMVLYPQDNQHPIAYWPCPMYPNVQATNPACGEFSQADIPPVPTKYFCSVCGEQQSSTPYGLCCKNGHGGAPSKDSP